MPAFFGIGAFHHAFERPHHSHSVIISPDSQGQLLRLPVIGEQFFVLVTQVVDHVLILLGAVSEGVETLGSHDRAFHQRLVVVLLQAVFFVGEVVLPLEEAIA